MKNKALVSLLVVVLILVAAVGAVPTFAQDDVTITILTNWGPDDPKGPVLQSILDDYMAANPGVSFELEIVPDTDIPTRVETSFLGGAEADLLMHNLLGPSLTWAEDGIVVPVTAYVEEWGLTDSFLDVALDQWTVNGELVGFPLEGFNWPVWYNTAIFEEAGVEIPTTTDELIAAADAIRAAGYQPFAIGGSDWTGSRLFQMYLSGNVAQDDVIALWREGGFANNEQARAAVETFVALREAGVFADSAEGMEFNSMNEMFFSGQAAMMHGGGWSYGELPEELLDVVVLGGFPMVPDSPVGAPAWWSGFTAKGIWISRNGAEKLDAIGPFIQFFFQPEMIARFVEGGGLVPPIKGVEVDAELLNPLFVQSLALAESGDAAFVPLAELYVPGPVSEPLDGPCTDVYVPGMSADDILAAMDETYEYMQ